MKKKSTMKWAALATGIILALCCAAAFAEYADKFANGTESTVSGLGADATDSVYGGSLNGTAASSHLTANSNITFVYGGGKASSVDSGSTPQTSSASITGDTQLFLSYGSCDIVYGGGYADAKGTHTVGGNTNIAMQNPNAVPTVLYGGGHASGNNENIETYAESRVIGNTSILLTNGRFDNPGHVAIAGGGDANYGSANVKGNTEIVISRDVSVINTQGGGQVGIFGGGVARNYGTAGVNGNTNITIAGGTLDDISVYGGGLAYMGNTRAYAYVSGDATITIQGAVGLKAIAMTRSLNGGGLNAGDNTSTADVKGTKSLVFDNAGTGSVSTKIIDFDVILLKGTSGITLTKALSNDVKSVKAEGTFTDGTMLLTLAEGSYKPSIVGTNVKWDGLKLVAGSSEKENPAEPTKPVFEEDVSNVISKDVVTVAPVIETDKTVVETKLSDGTDIKAADLDTDSSGNVVLNKSIVVTEGGDYSDAYMLPIFTATKTAGSTAGIIACSFTVNKADLLADTPEEVELLKIKGKTTTLAFEYSDKAEDFLKDGYFTIQTTDNKIADRAAAFTADKYKVTMFIKDNGEYDLDPTAESILDPAAIVKASETPTPSGGSSGGCSAGFAALALLALIPLAVKRKHNK